MFNSHLLDHKTLAQAPQQVLNKFGGNVYVQHDYQSTKKAKTLYMIHEHLIYNVQLNHYKALAEKLQSLAAKQEQELQEMHEQLTAATALTAAMSSKYRHSHALNLQLQQSLQDMQDEASRTATVLLRKSNLVREGPGCRGANKFTEDSDVDSAYMQHIQAKTAKPRFGIDAGRLSNHEASPTIHQASLAHRLRSRHAHTRDEHQQDSKSSQRRHPSGIAWATHMACITALFAMRWCSQIHQDMQYLTHQQDIRTAPKASDYAQNVHHIFRSTAKAMPLLVKSMHTLLPKASTFNHVCSWLLTIAYVLWILRLLPFGSRLHPILKVCSWTMVGYSMHAAWTAQLVLPDLATSVNMMAAALKLPTVPIMQDGIKVPLHGVHHSGAACGAVGQGMGQGIMYTD